VRASGARRAPDGNIAREFRKKKNHPHMGCSWVLEFVISRWTTLFVTERSGGKERNTCRWPSRTRQPARTSKSRCDPPTVQLRPRIRSCKRQAPRAFRGNPALVKVHQLGRPTTRGTWDALLPGPYAESGGAALGCGHQTRHGARALFARYSMRWSRCKEGASPRDIDGQHRLIETARQAAWILARHAE